ncbi:MAG: 16S rRNA (adenine(1518)-N(6)/adenine(1519)-N(6))-dimethyltransferase RsmA [Candidatus Micrarchaeota archaeon]|nr:16S rRNA (adenine(1518)-N(6)/adenine(1519)-N(6))-dimethyltransferase RsmA [Candidatus Micrarchaeota archaeon]
MRQKQLGQHFLTEESFLEEIAATLPKNKTVLEIGAGHGELTRFLAQRAKKVVAVEKDAAFIPLLKKTASRLKNVEIINADALDIDFKKYKHVAGNIPYSISSPLLFKILDSGVSEAVLLLQKEFAQRLTAYPGSDDWSRLSVMAQNAADIRIIDEVPKECFTPQPRVDSLVVHLKAKPKNQRLELDPAIIAALFQHKNQTVRNALVHSRRALGLEKDEITSMAEKTGFTDRRVREMALKELEALSKAFYSSSARIRK